MNSTTGTRLRMETPDTVQDQIRQLQQWLPHVVTEAADENGGVRLAVDFELLRQELSEVLADGDKERYQLVWPGKKQAILNANSPIDRTLRPLKDDGLQWESTKNVYIEGDNLEALKLLQESYLNKIKCIYIDPPYNTGKDFVYRDNYRGSAEAYQSATGQIDEAGNRLVANLESSGRYHSDWLTMLYARLKLARSLLRDDGVLFVSIDDNELDNLLKIGRELFGSQNLINTICVKMSEVSGKKMAHVGKRLPKLKEYVVAFKKANVTLKPVKLRKEQWDDEYSQLFVQLTPEDRAYIRRVSEQQEAVSEEQLAEIDRMLAGVTVMPVAQAIREQGLVSEEEVLQWKFDNAYRIFRTASSSSVKALADEKKPRCPQVYFSVLSKRDELLYMVKSDYQPTSKSPRVQVLFADDYLETHIGDLWTDINTTGLEFEGGVEFKNGKKPLKLVERLIDLVCDSHAGDIVLDFFSGSATTAEAVMNLNAADGGNRAFILVQFPEDLDLMLQSAEPASRTSIRETAAFLDSIGKLRLITEIGKERIRRASGKLAGQLTDGGFRVFRIDSSNMKEVYYKPAELGQADLLELVSNVKEDRTPEDLLVQVMLELGCELTEPIEEIHLEGHIVYSVANGSLAACFGPELPLSVVHGIARLKPQTAVFRDSCFAGDAVRMNVEELFKQLTPRTEIRVL